MARSKRIKGLKEALAALGSIPLEIRNKVQRKAIRAGAKEIQAVIRERITAEALVDTGMLRENIKIQLLKDDVGGVSASVGSSFRTWHTREFGTRFMRARPFLRPTLDAALDRVKVAMYGVLKKDLVRLANKKRRGG